MTGRCSCKAALSPALLVVAAWAGKAHAQAATDASAGSLSQFIADRVDRVGDHIGGLVRAVPRLPDNFRDVGLSFESAAGAASPGRVEMATLLRLLVGVLAELALRRAVRGLPARHHARAVVNTTDRLAVVGIDPSVELGGVIAACACAPR